MWQLCYNWWTNIDTWSISSPLGSSLILSLSNGRGSLFKVAIWGTIVGFTFVSFFTEPLSFTAYFPASCKPLCDIVCLFFFFSGGRETSVPVILSWPETKILLFIFETVKTGLFWVTYCDLKSTTRWRCYTTETLFRDATVQSVSRFFEEIYEITYSVLAWVH